MKKTFLIILLTILTISSIKSQEKIQFGVKGGINFTNMTSDFIIDKEYETGFYIGILAEIPFGSKFSLQPEVFYSTQGTKGKDILLTVPYPGAPAVPPIDIEYNLDYIQIPILAKIYLINNLSLELGPSFNFLVNDERAYANSSVTAIGQSFEFGGVAGVSYKIKSGFFANARYFTGFTDALEEDYLESRNYGFSIGIGYLF